MVAHSLFKDGREEKRKEKDERAAGAERKEPIQLWGLEGLFKTLGYAGLRVDRAEEQDETEARSRGPPCKPWGSLTCSLKSSVALRWKSDGEK